MQITDLVAIGKLGNNIDENGFIPFIKYKNFKDEFLTDVFLIFKDYRVRYVTVIETLQNKVLKIKIDDEYSTEEVINASGVKVAIPKTQIAQVIEMDEHILYVGKDLIFEDRIIGKIIDAFNNSVHDVLIVKLNEGKEIMIPFVDHYIEDNTEKSIIATDISDLLSI